MTLKLISKFVLVISISLSIFSCEKIIDIPVDESAQKVVIEAATSNLLGDSYVLLSKTATLYGQNIFKKVNNGTVKITDKNGVEVTFTEDGTDVGKYTHPTFVVTPNNTYTLQVNIEGKDYSAESSTQSTTVIDSIYVVKEPNNGFSPGGGGTNENDSINLVFLAYSDKVNEKNYYRFNVYTNGDRNKRMNITDDKVTNGQNINGPFFDSYESKDTVLVEMVNMDKANYTYFYSLANTSNGGPFSASPANPVTNLDNGALGYFGAYLKDTVSVIIP